MSLASLIDFMSNIIVFGNLEDFVLYTTYTSCKPAAHKCSHLYKLLSDSINIYI